MLYLFPLSIFSDCLFIAAVRYASIIIVHVRVASTIIGVMPVYVRNAYICP